MRRLLAPGGCPWDRAQSLQSLRSYVIEEAYEVVEAVEAGQPDPLCEELGDLLLQIVFQAELARARQWFGIDDVVSGICDKLVRRHPHVFGDEHVADAAQVVVNWERIKAAEKAGRGVLDGVPKNLPALLAAQRLGEKAARLGLDWPEVAAVRRKLAEELSELDAAIAAGDQANALDELGDVLFTLANLGRKLGHDPELALRGSLTRFRARVRYVEAALRTRGKTPEGASPEELDALWAEAKQRTADK